jgi:hypothetical protein
VNIESLYLVVVPLVYLFDCQLQPPIVAKPAATFVFQSVTESLSVKCLCSDNKLAAAIFFVYQIFSLVLLINITSSAKISQVT